MRLKNNVLAGLIVALAATSVALAEAEDTALDQLVRDYLSERGAEVAIAPPEQLARRYAIDLTGVVPAPSDIQATAAMAPGEMFDYFAVKGPMPHTDSEAAYVWSNLFKDADHFLFSNSSQFSQRGHVTELRDQLRRVYSEGWSYKEFATWALESQMFLNRFPSGADRANAAFFLFLGRDSFSSEVPVGDMWNGYYLRDDNIEASQAEVDPDYHVYDFDASRCTSGEAVCDSSLWNVPGSTPGVAIGLMVDSPMFAEATVDRYWARYVGSRLPGVEFPDIRRVLAQGFVASNYDVNWLIREITTSAVYTQEMMFR